jgi:hypothetical protein
MEALDVRHINAKVLINKQEEEKNLSSFFNKLSLLFAIF